MTATPPPPLPTDAPEALKAFVAGQSHQVVLDPSDVSWIPKPVPIVPDALMPSVRASNDRAPNSVKLSVGWGVFFRLKLHAAIGDGALQLRGGGPLHHVIAGWVAELNAWFSSTEPPRQIETLEVVQGKVLVRALPAGSGDR